MWAEAVLSRKCRQSKKDSLIIKLTFTDQALEKYPIEHSCFLHFHNSYIGIASTGYQTLIYISEVNILEYKSRYYLVWLCKSSKVQAKQPLKICFMNQWHSFTSKSRERATALCYLYCYLQQSEAPSGSCKGLEMTPGRDNVDEEDSSQFASYWVT